MLLKNKLLILIVVLGALMRFVDISLAPPSLNWDEAALGYNAFSVLSTGKDEYGERFPLITRSFDDYKSMLPAYPMMISISLFGLNEFGVRAATAFWGSLTIILMYALSKKLTSKRSVALLASLFYAIEPWAVHLNRVYHEATFGLFFYLAMVYLLLLSLEKRRLIIAAIICGFLALFSYHTYKVLVPLTVVGFSIFFKREFYLIPKKIKYISIVILIFGCGIFIHQIIFSNTLARGESASILRVLKPDNFVTQISGRYLGYFSPPNLFVREPREPASVVPGNSMFYPFEIVFWLVGLVFIFSKAKQNKVIIMLILVAPLTASFTWNWFQPARVMSLFSFYSIVVALGVTIIWKHSKLFFKVLFLTLLIPLLIMSSVYLFDSINYQIAARDYGSWQPGFRESMPTVYAKSSEYMNVVIDTPHAQPYIFVLFYTKYPASQYLSELDLQKIGNPRKVYDFGKYVFKGVNFSNDVKDPNTLYVLWKGSPAFGQFSDNELDYIKEVKNVDNDTIVKIIAFKKTYEK